MVMSKLHVAMEMKPVRSSLLRPALSIKKNCKGRKQHCGVVVLLHFMPLSKDSKNFINLRDHYPVAETFTRKW